MLRVKIKVNGEEKIVNVKEIYISSYEKDKAYYLLTCEDNRRYSGTELFESDLDEYDINLLSCFDFQEVK